MRRIVTAVEDFTAKKVVYVSSDITVAHMAGMMRERGLRRLPVVESDKLAGIIMERTMVEAGPPKATTLSIYEMNYLLNKTETRDVMIRDVVVVSPYASLEDAIYAMMKSRIGTVLVVESGQVYGVITDKDVFEAFLEISGHGEEGIRVAISVDDTVGTLAKIVDTISNDNLNIKRTVVATRKSGKVVIEIQVDGKADVADLHEKLLNQGIQVDATELAEAKSLD